MWSQRRLARAAILVAAAGAACGSPQPQHTPVPHTPTPSPSPAPTPTPPPDTLAVGVVTTGVGAWQLVAIPVAVVQNHALRHGATQVVVHFTTRAPGGRPLHSLDSVAVNLPPSATLIVAADCTDVCNGAASTDATVSVGAWVESPGIAFTATPPAYQCTAGCGGPENGEVRATVSTPQTVGAGAVVTAFADCTGPGGGIVGGGSAQVTWPGGSSTPVDIPVLVNRAPAACNVSASTGW
jgi:hypothetical protein